MTEYMASSPDVGRRPRISLIFAYSSGLRPSAAYGCSFSGVAMALETVSATCVAGVLTGKGLLDRGMPEYVDSIRGERMPGPDWSGQRSPPGGPITRRVAKMDTSPT